MKHRKRGALGLILSAAISLGMIGGAAANSYMGDVTPSERTVVSGCVVRFLPADDGRPSVHANGAHQCSGVKSVTVNQHGEVVINQTISDTSRYSILYVQAQADESLVTRGVTAGVSGGTGQSRVRLYDSKLGRQLDMTQRSDRARIAGDTSNLWLGWTHLDRGKR